MIYIIFRKRIILTFFPCFQIHFSFFSLFKSEKDEFSNSNKLVTYSWSSTFLPSHSNVLFCRAKILLCVLITLYACRWEYALPFCWFTQTTSKEKRCNFIINDQIWIVSKEHYQTNVSTSHQQTSELNVQTKKKKNPWLLICSSPLIVIAYHRLKTRNECVVYAREWL